MAHRNKTIPMKRVPSVRSVQGRESPVSGDSLAEGRLKIKDPTGEILLKIESRNRPVSAPEEDAEKARQCVAASLPHSQNQGSCKGNALGASRAI